MSMWEDAEVVHERKLLTWPGRRVNSSLSRRPKHLPPQLLPAGGAFHS